MSRPQKVLIFCGFILAALGMIYGLHYALFVEHQTLDGMGASLTEAFVQTADHQAPAANSALHVYTRTKYVYIRQVDVHSHWIGLAMLLIVLGATFNQVAFEERIRLWIATALVTGAVIFPLGVWLQTTIQGPLPSTLAIIGSGMVTVALVFTIIGFARSSAPGDQRRRRSTKCQVPLDVL